MGLLLKLGTEMVEEQEFRAIVVSPSVDNIHYIKRESCCPIRNGAAINPEEPGGLEPGQKLRYAFFVDGGCAWIYWVFGTLILLGCHFQAGKREGFVHGEEFSGVLQFR